MKPRRIIVTGGGTAGHIYPILEVVELLKKRSNIEILYIGGEGNIEEKIVPSVCQFKAIPVGKLRREFTLLHLRDATRIARGVVKARQIISEFKPQLIFAKGGYVSLPVIAVSAKRKIPLVIHESDSVLGLTNKIGSRSATKVCVSFPKRYYPEIAKNKIEYTGTPIRFGFFKSAVRADRQIFNLKRNLPVLLITGGSQGSLAINNALKPLISNLLNCLQIIHLTGEINEPEFIELKKGLSSNLKENYHVYGFLKKGMEEAVRVADLIISRSGSSIFEFAAAGKPMILIPLPTAGGGHQLRNAEIFTKEGAALTIRQRFLTSERLYLMINTLVQDPIRRKMMSENARKLAIPDSVDNVARVIEEVLRENTHE